MTGEINLSNVKLSNIEEKIKGLSAEQLKILLDHARLQNKKIQDKNIEEDNNKIREELEPLEEKREEAINKRIDIKSKFDSMISQVKERKKIALKAIDETILGLELKLDEKYKELGIKKTRRLKSPLISWHVEIVISKPLNAESKSYAIVGIKDQQDSFKKFNFEKPGKISTKLIKKFMEENDIEDAGEGKLRGLLQRIRMSYLTEVEKIKKEQEE